MRVGYQHRRTISNIPAEAPSIQYATLGDRTTGTKADEGGQISVEREGGRDGPLLRALGRFGSHVEIS